MYLRWSARVAQFLVTKHANLAPSLPESAKLAHFLSGMLTPLKYILVVSNLLSNLLK